MKYEATSEYLRRVGRLVGVVKLTRRRLQLPPPTRTAPPALRLTPAHNETPQKAVKTVNPPYIDRVCENAKLNCEISCVLDMDSRALSIHVWSAVTDKS